MSITLVRGSERSLVYMQQRISILTHYINKNSSIGILTTTLSLSIRNG